MTKMSALGLVLGFLLMGTKPAGCPPLVPGAGNSAPRAGWISLFDGKTLNGWKVGENAATFSVDSGCIIAHGQTAHLFYVGDVQNHDFKDFEFKADVMTKPGSNSGIYIHTQYQEGDWPE